MQRPGCRDLGAPACEAPGAGRRKPLWPGAFLEPLPQPLWGVRRVTTAPGDVSPPSASLATSCPSVLFFLKLVGRPGFAGLWEKPRRRPALRPGVPHVAGVCPPAPVPEASKPLAVEFLEGRDSPAPLWGHLPLKWWRPSGRSRALAMNFGELGQVWLTKAHGSQVDFFFVLS